MCRTHRRLPLGFESLVRIIKHIADGGNTEKSQQTLTKLHLIMDRVEHMVEQHPFHAPVLALHLSKVTKGLNIQARYRCVTCGGTCTDVHEKMLRSVEPVLDYLDPKGITQLQAIYAPCRNPQLWITSRLIELRSALIIYAAIRMKVNQTEDIDEQVTIHLDHIHTRMLAEVPTTTSGETLNAIQNQTFNIRKQFDTIANLKETHNHGNVNWRDICTAATSASEDSPVRRLLLYLASKAIEHWDTNALQQEEVKSVTRIIHCLHKAKDTTKSFSNIEKIIKQHARDMNLKDITCIIDVIQHNNISGIDCLLNRMDELLCRQVQSKNVDVKTMSVIIGHMAHWAKDRENANYIRIITIATDAIVSRMTMEPTQISWEEIFAPVALALKTLYSLTRQFSLQAQFRELYECCMDSYKYWIAMAKPYDLNEVLSILAHMIDRPQKTKRQTKQHPTTKNGTSNADHENRYILIRVVNRLCHIYHRGIDEYDWNKAHRRDTFMRNLCQFLRILQKHNVKTYCHIDENFNSSIYQMLLKRNAKIKTIDAQDIAGYLKTIYPNDRRLSDILNQTHFNTLI